MSGIKCHVFCVMCHVSRVMCRVSCLTCHLPLMLTVTATNPPPANSSIMHSRLVCKDPKTKKNFKKVLKLKFLLLFLLTIVL